MQSRRIAIGFCGGIAAAGGAGVTVRHVLREKSFTASLPSSQHAGWTDRALDASESSVPHTIIVGGGIVGALTALRVAARSGERSLWRGGVPPTHTVHVTAQDRKASL